MSFDRQKKQDALQDLAIIMDCADRVGIRKHVYVGFGLLLGIVRDRDFIGHDDDVDMCVQADKITAAQELRYFKELASEGMFFARRKFSTRRSGDGWGGDIVSLVRAYNRAKGQDHEFDEGEEGAAKKRFTWFSLRRRADHNKFCHWFMIPWNGYYWHTKSGKWVTHRKFDPSMIAYDQYHDDAIMKGVPQEYVEELIEIDFRGVKLNIPKNYGHCLDFWYPGWLIPMKGGSSAKTVLCRVPTWEDETKWKVRDGR